MVVFDGNGVANATRAKLEAALSNVKFLADERWLSGEGEGQGLSHAAANEYIRKNQEILRALHQVAMSLEHPSLSSFSGLRDGGRCGGGLDHSAEAPRTVRRVIPASRLARYGDYPYDESREFLYTVCENEPKSRTSPDSDCDPGTVPSSQCDLTFLSSAAVNNKEPWMLPEVGYYFSLYTRFVPRRLNQSKQNNNRVKRVTCNGTTGSHPSQDCAIYMNPPLYSKNHFLSTQLANRYCHFPRFVTTDSFGNGYRFSYQSRKSSYQTTKRCPKQWHKHRPFLDVNVSGFQPNIKPRIFNFDNALIPRQLSPLLAVTNGTFRSSANQQLAQFHNQIRCILPPAPAITNPLSINVYSKPATTQDQSITNHAPLCNANDGGSNQMTGVNGPEKVAAALTKVKTWLKKVYPKRSRDMKKAKRMSSQPLTFPLRNHQDDAVSLRPGSQEEADESLVSDVERCFADLEKEAIEQYQSSADDLLKKPVTPSEEKFQELERQALEQYQMQETSENSSNTNIVVPNISFKANLEVPTPTKTIQTSASAHRDSYRVALLRKTNKTAQSKAEKDNVLGKMKSENNLATQGDLSLLHGSIALNESSDKSRKCITTKKN